MFSPNFPSRDHACSASRLQVCDLNAQLAPLNLYGLGGVGAAVVDGLLALAALEQRRIATRTAALVIEASRGLA